MTGRVAVGQKSSLDLVMENNFINIMNLICLINIIDMIKLDFVLVFCR